MDEEVNYFAHVFVPKNDFFTMNLDSFANYMLVSNCNSSISLLQTRYNKNIDVEIHFTLVIFTHLTMHKHIKIPLIVYQFYLPEVLKKVLSIVIINNIFFYFTACNQ